jgi:hypothetical protein
VTSTSGDLVEAGEYAQRAPSPARGTTAERVARRAPLVTFAGVEAFALVLWIHVGRSAWFYGDEWDFLANRRANNLGDLFRSHNGHWTTLPVLAYRLQYSLFGLRAYFPYRFALVVLYLFVALLLMLVIRRAGVHPWIATAAASQFALFGAGWPNIVRPFQITFTGSLALGLVHLLLADHDGPFDRRDRAGLVAGFLGLMTSGVAIAMVIAMVIAVLLRRGWRVAFLHTAPLASCYLIWFLAIGRRNTLGVGPFNTQLTRPTFGTAINFVTDGFRSTLEAISPLPALAFLLVALLVVGFALAVRDRDGHNRRSQLAAPGGLLLGSIPFLLAAGITGRSGSDVLARYLSIVAVMVLPAICVAAGAFVTRWRWVLPIAVAFLAVGIPRNIHDGVAAEHKWNPTYQASRQVLLTLARDPLARESPIGLRPEPFAAGWVTLGWLRTDGASHMPATASAEQDVASNRFRLSFDSDRQGARLVKCQTIVGARQLTLGKGNALQLNGHAVSVAPASHAFRLNPALILAGPENSAVVVLRDVGRVTLTPALSLARIDGPIRRCEVSS